MRKKDKQFVPILFVFLAAFLPRAILALIYGAPFSVPMDEMSTIATSAMYGGYDWTGVTTVAKCYYGGGYVIFFSPLFRMGMKSYLIYDIMLLVSSVLQAIGGPICYYIMKKYFNITSKGLLFWTSVAASYLVALRVMMIFNEHMLIAVSWLIALTICKLIEHNENYRVKTIYTILLMGELSYIVTCHTRGKTYWYALAALIFLFYFLYKRWLVAIIPAVIFGAAGYFLSERFVNHIKTLVWHWEEGIKLKNSYVNLNVSLSDFKEGSTYQAILSTILGQINSTFVLSAGVFCILIVLILCIWYGKLKDVVLERYFHQEITAKEIQGEQVILMLSAFFGMCIVATTLAQSLTWLHKVLTAFEGGNTYGYKAFSYVRYNAIYYGPFFAAGMGYLYQCRDKLRNCFKAAAVLFAVTLIGWMILILPHINNVAVASRVYIPFGYLWYAFADEQCSAGMYLTAMLCVVICFTAIIVLLWKMKWKACTILFSLLLMYQYVLGVIVIDAPRTANYEKKVNATYDIFQKAEELGEGELLPENLYVVLKEKGNKQQPYMYQFLLYEHRIIWDMPSKDVEEAVVLSDKKNEEELFGQGYLRCKLDKNEYLYIKGASLIALFEKLGCTFYGSME